MEMKLKHILSCAEVHNLILKRYIFQPCSAKIVADLGCKYFKFLNAILGILFGSIW